MADTEADIRESTRTLAEKLDDLCAEREIVAMMKLSGRSLSAFLSGKPDLYTLRAAYR